MKAVNKILMQFLSDKVKFLTHCHPHVGQLRAILLVAYSFAKRDDNFTGLIYAVLLADTCRRNIIFPI